MAERRKPRTQPPHTLVVTFAAAGSTTTTTYAYIDLTLPNPQTPAARPKRQRHVTRRKRRTFWTTP